MATSPGDVLRELFNNYGPCLILIDEWVAYALPLHDQSDLPAGGFETQFSFAQVMTESAKLAKTCLLLISLPASDTSGSRSCPRQYAPNLGVYERAGVIRASDGAEGSLTMIGSVSPAGGCRGACAPGGVGHSQEFPLTFVRPGLHTLL
jgi:hypothetical protein